MPLPLPLRGLVSFVDRVLDPGTATRNAKVASAGLAEQLRHLDDVERAVETAAQVPSDGGNPGDAGGPSA
jgi:hypothetical protein